MHIVEEYLVSKGLEYKVGPNSQLIVRICPFCHDEKWHCYINGTTGLVHCKKCCSMIGTTQRGYNFNHLRDKFGDEHIKLDTNESIGTIKVYKKLNADQAIQYASRLRNTPQVMEYLMQERLLSEVVIREYSLGFTGEFISFPLYENRTLTSFIYRYSPFLPEREGVPRYKTESGAKPILFNVDCLRKQPKRVLITEGVLDALVLISMGSVDVLSIPMGAGYFNKDWVPLFDGVQEIYTCYDNDDVGQQGAAMVAALFGDRCKNIVLPKEINGKPVKDITDFFKNGGSQGEFVQLYRQSVTIENKATEIRSLAGFKDDLVSFLRSGSASGYMCGLKEVDDLLGGFRKGHLTVISGLPGAGKTAFSQNAAYHIASQQKVPTFFFSLEMTPLDIVKRYITIVSDITGEDMSGVMNEEQLGLVSFIFELFKDVPLYLFNGEATLTVETLRELIIKAIKEKGIELIFIDHLHYFSQSTAHKSSEIGNIIRGIRNIARDLNIPVVLLCHLNRSGRSQQKTGMYVPSLSDLKDSSGIEQDASEVVFVCRDADCDIQSERQKVIFKVAKNRDGQVGVAQARFNETKLTFESIPACEVKTGEGNRSQDVHIDF